MQEGARVIIAARSARTAGGVGSPGAVAPTTPATGIHPATRAGAGHYGGGWVEDEGSG